MKSEMLLVHKPFLADMAKFDLAAKHGKPFFSKAEGMSDEDCQSLSLSAMNDWLKLTGPRVVGNVAIIPVRGSLTYDDPFAKYYGDSTTSKIEEYYDNALADPAISSIILHVHSPGGQAYAIDTLANKVKEGSKVKPTYGYTDTIAASAACWVFAACSKRFYGSGMAQIGSIGVYSAVFNYSKVLEKNGVTVDEYTAGKYKAAGSPYHPNTADEKQAIQDQVDSLYSVFVNSMATLLGKSVDDVLKFADGRTYTGDVAKKLGLADAFSTLEGVIKMAGTKTESAENPSAVTPEPTAIELNATISALNARIEAVSAQLTLAEASSAKLSAELAAFKDKEAKITEETAKLAVTAEAKDLYKKHFNRDATDAELSAYIAFSPEARSAFNSALAATSIKPNLGALGTEVATDGIDPSKPNLFATAFAAIDRTSATAKAA